MDHYRNYDKPVQVADGIYWVGSYQDRSIQCNPYLIIENGHAVLIDPGSRADFATVIMKVLQTGIDPKQIDALVYQHYDPDLCGSMSNIIAMCDNPDLKILSTRENILFLGFYVEKQYFGLFRSIDDGNAIFDFHGRSFRFIPTPYCHSQGSFVTYDEKSKTLFGSDLFGSFVKTGNLFQDIDPECYTCSDHKACSLGNQHCIIENLEYFHKKIMPSSRALHLAMKKISEVEIDCLAPQHGFVFRKHRDIQFIIDRLQNLKNVGGDGMESC